MLYTLTGGVLPVEIESSGENGLVMHHSSICIIAVIILPASEIGTPDCGGFSHPISDEVNLSSITSIKLVYKLIMQAIPLGSICSFR